MRLSETAKTYSLRMFCPYKAGEWLEWFHRQNVVRTDDHGRVNAYRDGDYPHSQRVSVVDDAVAAELFKRVNVFGNITVPRTPPVQRQGRCGNLWACPRICASSRRCGMGSSSRTTMRSSCGTDRQTLLSLVIYLTDTEGTRFLEDPTGCTAVTARDRSDWNRPPNRMRFGTSKRRKLGSRNSSRTTFARQRRAET